MTGAPAKAAATAEKARQERAMAVHALTEVEVAAGRASEALRATVRLEGQLVQQPGFRRLRVFRSPTSEDTLLVLSEWEEWDALATAEAVLPIARLLAPLRAVCCRWHERRLEPLFQLELPRRHPSVGLAQGLQIDAGGLREAQARQKSFGLKAMSLPGTLGVLGGRCAQDDRFFFCAVEFETEDARQDFLGSAAWHEWNRAGVSTVWRKEVRLEIRALATTRRAPGTERRSEELGRLSVRIDSSPDGSSVVLSLDGSLDDTAAERFERVREAVVAGGCRSLTLDVSDLVSATTAGLTALLATARQIKAAGGQFTLVDHQGRYDQILRVWHLNRALADEKAPRRRSIPLRLPSPGEA